MHKITILEESGRQYCNIKIELEYSKDMEKAEVLDDAMQWQQLYREKLKSNVLPHVPEPITDKQLLMLRSFTDEVKIRSMQHASIIQLPTATKEEASKAISFGKELIAKAKADKKEFESRY